MSQVTQWPATTGEGPDLVGGRGAAADHDAGVLVAEPAVAGARIGDLPRGAVLEVDLVLVLVEAGGHLDLGADRPEHSAGIVAGLYRQRQSAAEVPVLTTQLVLEVAAGPDGRDVWVRPGREEHPELQLSTRFVAPELPGPATLIHEDHRPTHLGKGMLTKDPAEPDDLPAVGTRGTGVTASLTPLARRPRPSHTYAEAGT